MKTIFKIAKVALSLTLIGATAYAESFFPLLGVVAAALLISFRSMVNKEFGGLTILTMTVMFCSSFFYLGIGVRTVHYNDSSVKIVTPFYPVGQVLGEGIRLDTLQLASCIEETDYGTYKIMKSDMLVLTKDDSTKILFNNYDLVLSGKQLNFLTHKTPWGKIHVCEFIDEAGQQHVWDLYGRDISAIGYIPKVIYYIPDYCFSY